MLTLAACKERTECARLLLEAGASIGACCNLCRESARRNPLIQALLRKHDDFVRLLIAHTDATSARVHMKRITAGVCDMTDALPRFDRLVSEYRASHRQSSPVPGPEPPAGNVNQEWTADILEKACDECLRGMRVAAGRIGSKEFGFDEDQNLDQDQDKWLKLVKHWAALLRSMMIKYYYYYELVTILSSS